MKIKYLSLYGGSPDDGVNRKIMNQVTALIRLGLDVEMIIVTTDNTQFPSYDFLTVHTGRTDGIYVRMQRALKIRKVFKKTIESLDQRSILYYRCSSYFPLYYPINYLKLFRACKIVTEHQTVESEQLKLNRRHLGFLCEKIFGKFIRKQSDAMVGVTNEIAQYHLARAGDLKKPHITIGNGFDVESVNVRKPAPHLTENIHCLCVANFSRWHGADRFLRGITEYHGLKKIVFHIVGDGAELGYLKNFSRENGITEHVIFHGFRTGKDLDDLFNSCQIAVGSLGLHRLGLTEASILKAREYCSRGIPYIIACKDPDFPDEFPYIFQIPADENAVDIVKVIEFAQKVYADPDHPQKMRTYAVKHLDWSVKMRLLKEFLEELVDKSNPPS